MTWRYEIETRTNAANIVDSVEAYKTVRERRRNHYMHRQRETVYYCIACLRCEEERVVAGYCKTIEIAKWP